MSVTLDSYSRPHPVLTCVENCVQSKEDGSDKVAQSWRLVVGRPPTAFGGTELKPVSEETSKALQLLTEEVYHQMSDMNVFGNTQSLEFDDNELEIKNGIKTQLLSAYYAAHLHRNRCTWTIDFRCKLTVTEQADEV